MALGKRSRPVNRLQEITPYNNTFP
uniref:Uncharacterized protein n=1 Tax=Anguilla anguilla TaxID=7936 RepID=A0A0E9V0T2_ANGAN